MSSKEKARNSVKKNEEQLDSHRQFHKIYFEDYGMDFAFQWLLGSARYGGCEIGEAFYTASQITGPESWSDEWLSLAKRVEIKAENAESKKHKVSAREFYLRATNYYRIAMMSLSSYDLRMAVTTEKMRRCMKKASLLFDPSIEPIELPFENRKLHGYFIRADKSTRKHKTLIAVGGGETYAEDVYFHIAPSTVARGYNFLTVEIPGQGNTPAEGLYFRPDVEIPLKVIIDYALSRPEVDPKYIAAYGFSAGGYFVPRTAAHDSRIKACIANYAITDFGKILAAMTFRSKEEMEELKKVIHLNYRTVETVAWRWNISTNKWKTLIDKNKDYVFNPQEIFCPMLSIISEGKYKNPIVKKMQEELMEALPNQNKKIIVGSFEDGAGTHCYGENTGLLSSYLFDWLDEIFENKIIC